MSFITVEVGKFQSILTVFQVAIIVLYALYTDYEDSLASLAKFGLFQNVQVMIFVGFGFLMTFMRRYGWGAVGFTMFYALVAILVTPLILGFFHHIYEGEAHKTRVKVDIMTLMNGEFCAGAVLITLGGVIGKISPLQMLVVTLVECFFYAWNEVMVYSAMAVTDAGGTTVIHAFGAYFGLALSLCVGNPGFTPETSRKSALFSMIGTLFLFMYWPSFNAGPTEGAEQQRAIVNTVLSIGASAISAFLASKILRGNKFEMEDIQNATLAGGVAMGASATMRVNPMGAMIIGYIAGVISVAGFVHGSPLLRRWGVCDTCGINNLHGMPAMFGALTSAIVTSMADAEGYKGQAGLEAVFPAMAPCAADAHGPCGRTNKEQAFAQISALAVTMLMANLGGFLAGAIVRQPFFEPLKHEACFEDSESWNLEDGDEGKPMMPPVTMPPVSADEKVLEEGYAPRMTFEPVPDEPGAAAVAESNDDLPALPGASADVAPAALMAEIQEEEDDDLRDPFSI